VAKRLNRWEFPFPAVSLLVENGIGSPLNLIATF